MSTSRTKDKYQIAVVPGDGIGREVMKATIDVLDSLDIDFEYVYGEAGDECLEKNGTALPSETLDIIRNADACLFGAAGETAADVIVKIRQEMKMFANLRPVKAYPHTNSLSDDIDFMIVRENTEGMYIADEEKYTDEGAIARRIITREAERRIIDYAFNYAVENDKSKVTAVHKANVLKKTDGLFKEIFYEVAEDYPDIATEDFYVDATAMYLITQPESFEVIVTTNLFGDILSDEGAGLVGGLGLIPSANIGLDGALFEPVHGSAPDIAGKGIANPIAMMLSAVMMLRYLGENEAADKFDAAILKLLNDANTLTGDLGGSATTMEVAGEVIKNLNGE
ncbi:MAG: NAD-dependent isocitrate dehydrogenase [Methanobrevibacter thaueri]|uniref:isocitrate/isopropylmalate family dehydrogenase n=1 Tax=Methanobrevibacter thaueri TaxID=190975 RepID=UPI0026F190F3|nr:isocitrate/isopropylmalate family dehydrogenase [Methanobrevibacter thaueri]MBE6495790.1 NAD-dependent isocitrate dehydrogenase [Methanobrevibacter thaueri]